MNSRAKEQIGCAIDEIDTPALLVDAAILEDNIRRMAAFGRKVGVNIRPHAKAHKTPLFAHKQMMAGAIGVCCQKVSEAEVMVLGGIPDILISNEVIGRPKLEELMILVRRAKITVAVDSEAGAEMLSAAAQRADVDIGAIVDIDVGQGRCGRLPGQPSLSLGQYIEKLPRVTLRGLQGYQGRLQHTLGYPQRAAAAKAANGQLMETRALFEQAGLSTEIVSAAGTGTYDIEGTVRGVTEIQPGSYIFMDRQYRAIGSKTGEIYDDFGASLTVLATVISQPTPDRAVLDSGLKSLSNDAGPAEALQLRGWTYEAAGDEHGILRRSDDNAAQLQIGDKIRLLPSHCDTTVNLFDEFHIVRNGKLEGIVSIEARGKTQ